ncbi:hypothetical protein Trihar35433_6079 [Trichoderma harzianum]|nr:hypothetical protein Trihar35433_6079 [Trichoderma harzianum]
MAPRDDQFEAQIEPYRRERRLLVARNIYWEATRAEFETTVRTRLTMGDTVSRFFWLPQTDRSLSPVPTPVSASAAAAAAAAAPAATNRNPSDSTEEPRTSWW